jgi:hypothetical protein
MKKIFGFRKVLFVSIFSLLLCSMFLEPSLIARRRRAIPRIINPVSFNSKNIEIYLSCVSGRSYGWKLLCALALSRPDYNTAIKNLWKNSGIPIAEQSKYELVNIREIKGTEWGVIVTGQDYLTVIADIGKKV